MKKLAAGILIIALLAISALPDQGDRAFSQEDLSDAEMLVQSLIFSRFKQNIAVLAQYGDRKVGAKSNIEAGNWLELQLKLAGYQVERHSYLFGGQYNDNIYVTKIGTEQPDEMYIVSAHFDGTGGGGAVDDNASGAALVLEAARIFADENVETDVSVRFIFWNSEEIGLIGSQAYVEDRRALQGVEDPRGSGIYPEPRWLGIIQHDMILYDHGLPPGPDQIPEADLDIEFQQLSLRSSESRELAAALLESNELHSTDYPAEVGDNMNHTGSASFENYTAAVSVRENRRVSEIGLGANPHWHQPTDVYETYSELDFKLGFNALQMTVGAIANLAGARVVENSESM